jgi:hypothetical protein
MAQSKKSSAGNNGQPPPTDPGPLSLDENGSHDEEEDGSQLQEPSEEQPFQPIEGLEHYVQKMQEEQSDACGKLKEELSASEESGAKKTKRFLRCNRLWQRTPVQQTPSSHFASPHVACQMQVQAFRN